VQRKDAGSADSRAIDATEDAAMRRIARPRDTVAHPGSASQRCWPTTDPLYVTYHDDEWGRPVTDERGLYERLCLEGFQSGLSWLTILRKRESFRRAFANFDPDAVARYGERDVKRLLGDAGIVRHRGKIEATIANARGVLALREAGTPLPDLVWSHAPLQHEPPRTAADWQAQTDESKALSKLLKTVGFRFVGPTTVWAAMQACGVVNDHLISCPVRATVEESRVKGLTPQSGVRPGFHPSSNVFNRSKS
jgi:DNA-3-methyladenine glycosylase I